MAGMPKLPKIASLLFFFLQYLQKVASDEVDFLHADELQSFLQVDFNTLGIKVSCKVILSLLISMVKHSQVLKITSLQYLYNIPKKEVKDGVHVFACK